MAGYPIDVLSNVRYYIDDHRRGAFELGAPTTDVLDVTGRPAEDFETIARRYAALPRNQRTLGNWLREFAQFMIAPLSPGFNFDRYDRELRRPFPSEPQFAPESKVWRREHGIADRRRKSVSRQSKQEAAQLLPRQPARRMAGISIRRNLCMPQLCFFREHRIQLHRVGNRHRSIYLAGTPPPATGRSVAASAHPAQLPLHRVGISGPRRRVA